MKTLLEIISEEIESFHNNLLNESVSDVMYHFTYSYKLYNILKTNEILLSPGFINKADIKNKNLYFLSLSTSRSLDVGYGASMGSNGIARLTMNGRALNQNYKSQPVDYWERSRTPNQDPRFSNAEAMKMASRFDELEERILSDKDRIKPANKYITTVEVLNVEPNRLPVLKKLCDNLNIEFYAYNNRDYFNMSLKAKAINIGSEEEEYNEISDTYEAKNALNIISEILAYLTYKDNDLKEKIFNELPKFGVDLNIVNKFVDEIQNTKLKYYLRVDDNYEITDLANSLTATLHNSKNTTINAIRYVIREFGLDMKRNGIDSIKEYLRYKVWKGKKTQKQFNIEFNKNILNEVDRLYSDEMNKLKEYHRSAEFNDEYYDNVYDYPPIKNLLDSKVDELKKFYSNYILNNNDMFRYSFYISSDEARKALNLGQYSDDKYDPQFDTVLNGLTYGNIDAGDLIQILRHLIYEVDSFASEEIKKMQEEYNKQI